MARFTNHSLAAIAAVVLTFVSMQAIVTVPPAQSISVPVPELV